MDKGDDARAQAQAFESSNAATGDREEDETNRAACASAKGGNSPASAWDIAAGLSAVARAPRTHALGLPEGLCIGVHMALLLHSQGAQRRAPGLARARGLDFGSRSTLFAGSHLKLAPAKTPLRGGICRSMRDLTDATTK